MKNALVDRPVAKILGCACLLAMLAACASVREISEQGVKANLSVEEAHNQILLLNIVRAYNRRPMHFTRFQGLRGSIGIGAPTITIPTPFGPDFRTQVYNVSTQYTPDKPGFDVAVLDTQKFVRGITTPITFKTMKYYLDQGWPQQLILHLFIREIQVFEEKTNLDNTKTMVLSHRYINYSQNLTQFKEFQRKIELMHECDFVSDEKPGVETIGPILKRNEVRDLKHLVEVKGADLVLVPVDDKGDKVDPGKATGYKLQKPKKDSVIELKDKWPQKAIQEGREQSCGSPIKFAIEAADGGHKPSSSGYMTFQLRSPEAVLYYLGEIARAQLEGGYTEKGDRVNPEEMAKALTIALGHPRDPKIPRQSLFVMRKDLAGDTSKGALRVTYEDYAYSVPTGPESGRSMHAISLVTQIINMNNEGNELPATATVRIAN